MAAATSHEQEIASVRAGPLSNRPIAEFETWHYLWRDIWQLYPDHLRHESFFIKFRLSRRDVGLEHLKPEVQKRWRLSPPSELLLLVSVCHWGIILWWLFAFHLPALPALPMGRLFLVPLIAVLPFSIERQILFTEKRLRMRLPWWQARCAAAFSGRVVAQITRWNSNPTAGSGPN